MAKLPKKIATSEDAATMTSREFVSGAAIRPASGSNVTRVNLSLTGEDMDASAELQEAMSLSRVEIFRAGLVALNRLSASEKEEIAGEIRRNSPKAGRPAIKR